MYGYREFNPTASLWRRRCSAALALIVLAAFVVAVVRIWTSVCPEGQPLAADPLGTTEERAMAVPESIPPDVAKVAKQAVWISVQAPGHDGNGTGFLFDSDVVVTASHVVGEAKPTSATVNCGGVKVEGEIIYNNPKIDTAILRAPGCPAERLRLASDLPQKGERLYLARYNFYLKIAWRDVRTTEALPDAVPFNHPSSTKAVRTLLSSGTKPLGLAGLADQGNSGSAVVDRNGAVVGMAVFVSSAQGVTYAVTADDLKAALKKARVL